MTVDSGGKRPGVCLLVYNTIADDPRVRRQGDALSQAGWRVTGIGLPGGRAEQPDWLSGGMEASGDEAAERQEEAPEKGLRKYKALRAVVRRLPRPLLRMVAFALYAMRFALLHAAVLLFPRTFDWVYWRLFPRSREMYESASQANAVVWLANDWNTLPIAMRLQKEKGGAIIYDTHEFAVDEYDQKLVWRILRKPLVSAVENAALRSDKTLVSTVSDGIADALKGIYGLNEKPVVIRNTPRHHDSTPRPTGADFRVLYHGVVAPGRGLEECIDAASRWKQGVRLYIRGPVTPAYKDFLTKKVSALGVGDKVTFLPPVPMPDLVRAAAEFDVGLFALPGHSRHNLYALPNKLFEYVSAGLCVCVSDLPEMAALVEHYDVGRLIEGSAAGQIAAAIDSLSAQDIDRYKARAVNAAAELCWEKESQKLIGMVERACNKLENGRAA